MASTNNQHLFRRVDWVHKPLARFRDKIVRVSNKERNVFEHFAKFNHQAILVTTVDPKNGEDIDSTLFELERVHDDQEHVIQNVVLNASMEGWRGIGILNWGRTRDIVGYTSMTNDEIYNAGYDILHYEMTPSYDVLVNNCQNYASDLFDKICDIQGSGRAKWIRRGQDFDRKVFGGRDFKGTLGKTAGILVLGAIAAGAVAATKHEVQHRD